MYRVHLEIRIKFSATQFITLPTETLFLFESNGSKSLWLLQATVLAYNVLE